MNVDSCNIQSETSIIYEQCLISDPPGEPRDLEIAKFDKSSVTLKWKAPTDDGGNPIQGMFVSLSSIVLGCLDFSANIYELGLEVFLDSQVGLKRFSLMMQTFAKYLDKSMFPATRKVNNNK